MVSWANTCKPKNKGGLGIPSLPAIRFSYDCSLILRIYKWPSPLSDWFLSMHCSPWKPPAPSSSAMWKSICCNAMQAKPNFIFKPTENCPISLLWDHWFNGECIRDNPGLNSDTILCGDHTKLDMLINSGCWNIPNIFSVAFSNSASSIPIDCGGRVNCLTWGNYPKHNFSCFMRDYYKMETDVAWSKAVWHKHSALRFSLYGWLSLVGGLKTSEALRQRNLEVDPLCILCHCHVENTSHLFFQCDYSFGIICSLLPSIKSFLLRPNLFQISDHLLNCGSHAVGESDVNLLTLWASVYTIWRERNARIFAHQFHSSFSIKNKIKKVVEIKLMRWKKN